MDSLDWKLLRELQEDARLSSNELARRVGLSSPAVAERVRRMEDARIIVGYRAEIDPATVGLPIMILVQMRCESDKCLLKMAHATDFPEVLEAFKVSGPYCTVVKVAVASIAHLEEVFERLGRHGELRSSMIWSSELGRRVIDWENGLPEVEAAPEWE